MPSVQDEFPQFEDKRGKPITNGKIYIGEENTDPTIEVNQIPIYTDDTYTVELENPQTTDAYGRSKNRIHVKNKYSIQVDNSQGIQQFINLSAGELPSESQTIILSNVQGSSDITAESEPPLTEYTDNNQVIFKAAANNTGITFISIDGLTPALRIVKAGGLDLNDDDIRAGQTVVGIINTQNNTFEYLNAQGKKHNLTANTYPMESDDISLGYEEDSRWIDKSTGIMYVCTENAQGAAMWPVMAGLVLNEQGGVNAKIQGGITVNGESTIVGGLDVIGEISSFSGPGDELSTGSDSTVQSLSSPNTGSSPWATQKTISIQDPNAIGVINTYRVAINVDFEGAACLNTSTTGGQPQGPPLTTVTTGRKTVQVRMLVNGQPQSDVNPVLVGGLVGFPIDIEIQTRTTAYQASSCNGTAGLFTSLVWQLFKES